MMEARIPFDTGKCQPVRWGIGVLAIGLSLVSCLLLGSEPASSLLAADPLSTGRSLPAVDKQTAEGVASKLVAVRMIPQDPTLWGSGASQRFLVLARYADGMERDVTTQSSFSTSQDLIAKVKDSGRVLALADGKVVLSASFGGQVVRTTVRVACAKQRRNFSFARDIGGIFTKNGCNGSNCHSSVKGQGGFKLSANALYPKEDYQWTIEGGTFHVMATDSPGPKTPRINLKEPEKSLLLLKPTMSLPHGGGQKIAAGSSDYETILNWIRSGAPYGEEGDKENVRIAKLEIFPKRAVLDSRGKHQLLVTAYLSNGRSEDITDEVLFASNNPEVAEVSSEGLVTAKKIGETAVIVRAAGHVISSALGVISKPISNYPPKIPRRNLIDELVFAKLRQFNIIPSGLSTDAEFLRRLCLDVTGSLPPTDRVREFLADKDSRKRDKLIEILLASPEYVDYWTYRFGEFLRLTTTSTQDLGYTQLYGEWIRDSIDQNKPYDQMARERIAAQGFNSPVWYYWTTREITPLPDITTEQVRVFFGRRLGCARCHNHPYESWSQDQFWGMTAFFGRMTQVEDVAKMRKPTGLIIDDPGGYSKRDNGKVIHPRTKKEVEPQFLDGTVLPESERVDLRMRLAEWMTSPRNTYFAEAIVNRIWDCFFGKGIVDPVDDFRTTNPPTHPELLDALAQDLIQQGYDLKHLMRLILQSRTYQLSADSNETNQDDKTNYSRAMPRPLDPAVLQDAIARVTGVEPDFVKSGEKDSTGNAPPGLRAIELLPEQFPSRFLEVCGRNDRRSMPEEKPGPTLGLGLHMLVGPTYTDRLSQEGGRIDRLLKSGKEDSQIIEEFYLAALCRFPTSQEEAALRKAIAGRPSRPRAIESLAWALISSREFAYSH
ncbi:MAG: DUF1553 domain-containing protein [Acidobacteria bacterium]|nr:DUF1553 domain-containing protein [Acidobacteriota bacterium]